MELSMHALAQLLSNLIVVMLPLIKSVECAQEVLCYIKLPERILVFARFSINQLLPQSIICLIDVSEGPGDFILMTRKPNKFKAFLLTILRNLTGNVRVLKAALELKISRTNRLCYFQSITEYTS